MAKNPRINIRGVAVYPALNTADTKFHDLGMYKADVRVGLDEAKPIMERLGKIHLEWTGKEIKPGKTNLWVLDENDQGERTGTVTFRCKVKNIRRKDGQIWDRKPKQYDTQNNVINEQVWGGTEYVVGAEVYCWQAGADKGVSLQPVAVQIIELVGPSGDSDTGFDTMDGGFVGGFNSETDDVAPASADAPILDNGDF